MCSIIPVLLTTAAHPSGHCVAPFWALQRHSSASWRRCCFLRACPRQSKHLDEQLEGHPKERCVCQLLWLCYCSPIISSTLASVFHTKWLCWLLHTPILGPLFLCCAQKKNLAFFHNSFKILPHVSPLNSPFKLLFYCAAKKLLGSAKCSGRVW